MGDQELLVLNGEQEPWVGEPEVEARPGDKSCLNLVHLAAVVAAIGGILFGYDVGVISGAKIQVRELYLTLNPNPDTRVISKNS